MGHFVILLGSDVKGDDYILSLLPQILPIPIHNAAYSCRAEKTAVHLYAYIRQITLAPTDTTNSEKMVRKKKLSFLQTYL